MASRPLTSCQPASLASAALRASRLSFESMGNPRDEPQISIMKYNSVAPKRRKADAEPADAESLRRLP
jgi:hypothetical protein